MADVDYMKQKMASVSDFWTSDLLFLGVAKPGFDLGPVYMEWGTPV